MGGLIRPFLGLTEQGFCIEMEKSGDKWGLPVLLGQFQVRVDEKGRLAIPKRFRAEIGRKLIVTQGYENCLLVVNQSRWHKLIKEVQDRPLFSQAGRETRRFLLGGAFDLELDRQGRFIIPAVLKSYAGLKKDSLCLGVGNYLEIWDLKRWQEYQQYLDKHIEKIAEKLTRA